MEKLGEFLKSPSANIRLQAIQGVFSHTGTNEGIKGIKILIPHILKLVNDENLEISTTSINVLINSCVDSNLCTSLSKSSTIDKVLKNLQIADLKNNKIGKKNHKKEVIVSYIKANLMLIMNLTREETGCEKLLNSQIEQISNTQESNKNQKKQQNTNKKNTKKEKTTETKNKPGSVILQLIQKLFDPERLKEHKNQKKDSQKTLQEMNDSNVYLVNVLMNVTQTVTGRLLVIDFMRPAIKDLFLPYIMSKRSKVVVRQTIIGLIRNLCYEKERHVVMANLILPYVMARLTTKEMIENLDEEDYEKFPALFFQFMKQNRLIIETDHKCRKWLVECLVFLTGSRTGRDLLREIKVYYVLRELDEIEEEEDISEQIYQYVQIVNLDEIGGNTNKQVVPLDELKISKK
ncbi:protein hgh1 [Anaeramoeba flamelloides]|uniref:Protein HGH1 homolog n=1 Tax=Anaeramoeba flamelloides TaxID=1746091 RepID=A0AAV7ZRQ2_9EUKA|nr:protein hgh1 [Anaeramoeba flamelloides]